MDVVHQAGVLSAVVGALAVAGLWLAWGRTRGRPLARTVAMIGIILVAVLANLGVRKIAGALREPSSAPEIAGTRALRPPAQP